MDCRFCELRPKCLRSEKSEYRQVNFIQDPGGPKPKTFSAIMRNKIDSIKADSFIIEDSGQRSRPLHT